MGLPLDDIDKVIQQQMLMEYTSKKDNNDRKYINILENNERIGGNE